MATPSHVDLSVLWVPIMPETSKLGEQMEKVGQDATESFGKGSSGLGDKIHDSITKSKDKLKDVFHRTGTDASEAIADGVKESSKKVEDAVAESGKKAQGRLRESTKQWGSILVDAIGPDTKKLLGDRLEEVVGGSLEGVLGDKSKLAGQFAHTVSDWGLDELKNKLGSTKDAADKTRKAFADFGKGDTIGGVSKLVEGMGKLGIETKDLPQPLQDAIGKLGEAKTTAQGFADIFNGLPGKVGLVGKAIEGLAGPLAVALAASKDIDDLMRQDGLDPNAKGDAAKKQFEDGFKRIHRDGNGNIVVDPKSSKPPGVDMGGVDGIGTGGDVLGSSSDAYDVLSTGKALAPPTPPTPPLAPPTPPTAPPIASPAPSSSDVLPSSFTSGISTSASSPAELHASGSRIANLYRVANALQGTPYSQALRNDCSGMVSRLTTAALGMDPSVQFSTTNEGDYLFSHGFQPGQGPAGSFRVGWYDHGGGNAGHTAATLPDGTHAESGGSHGSFLLGSGAAGADNPEFEHHAWLPMDGSAGGRNRPVGDEHDPLYVTQTSSGGSDTQSQGQQLGSGLIDGLAQSIGLDGSVFKGFGGASNPAHFGITKLATGLISTFAGGGVGGDGAAMSFGGGGGIPGLGMLQGLIPGAGVSSGVVPTGPGGAQNVRSNETVNHNNIDNSMTVNGVPSPDVPAWQHTKNGMDNRTGAMATNNGGNLPG